MNNSMKYGLIALVIAIASFFAGSKIGVNNLISTSVDCMKTCDALPQEAEINATFDACSESALNQFHKDLSDCPAICNFAVFIQQCPNPPCPPPICIKCFDEARAKYNVAKALCINKRNSDLDALKKCRTRCINMMSVKNN